MDLTLEVIFLAPAYYAFISSATAAYQSPLDVKQEQL